MKVWVIMGNDYPDSVFASEKAAKDYIALKQKDKPPHHGPMIYWRSYPFEVQS